MADLQSTDSSVTAVGSLAGVPIVALVPESENAVLSLVQVYLNGINVTGSPYLTVKTEERTIGSVGVTVVVGVQVGAEIVTDDAMALVIVYADVSEAS